MTRIMPDILTLAQYISAVVQQNLSDDRGNCPYCSKAGLWLWGHYERKADRASNPSESLNPILITRLYCKFCKRTHSVLPECIPPLRWYLWSIQQAALAMCLLGNSFRAVAKTIGPSRHTISRWFNRLQEQFRLHKDALCNHNADLGRTVGLVDFWENCLKTMCLGKAMRLCHVAGVIIP